MNLRKDHYRYPNHVRLPVVVASCGLRGFGDSVHNSILVVQKCLLRLSLWLGAVLACGSVWCLSLASARSWHLPGLGCLAVQRSLCDVCDVSRRLAGRSAPEACYKWPLSRHVTPSVVLNKRLVIFPGAESAHPSWVCATRPPRLCLACLAAR